MKMRLHAMLTAVMLAALSFSFTSCEDESIASSLQGTWEGNMYISSEWNGRVYNATYTEIEFLLDPFRYTKGSGYWVDHYSGAPWDYIANHIDWRVDDQVITVYFREENTSIQIYDYRLSDNYFRGTIYDNGNYVDFSLVHTSSPNWEYEYDYWGYDDWYYYDGWYGYSKKQNSMEFDGIEMTPDSIGNDSTKPSIEKPRRFVRAKE